MPTSRTLPSTDSNTRGYQSVPETSNGGGSYSPAQRNSVTGGNSSKRPVHLARDLVRKGLSSITNRATDGGESLSPAENQQRRLAMKDASTQLQSYYAAFKEEKRWRYRVEDAKNPKENMTGELPTADYEWDKSKTRLRTERKPTESSINTVSRYSTYREDLTANLKKRGAKSDIVEAMWKDLGYEAKVDEPLSEKNSEA